MSSTFLLYGSYGFVGNLIAREAVEQGLRPILAGRNAARVAAHATALGLEYRVFTLDDAIAIDNALADVDAVLHLAGPYARTFEPMVDGCLRTGTHYLDLTGEIPVFQAIADRDGEARARGVMLLPGVGFDVVPSDCLAVHLKRQLPSATRLTLAFHNDGTIRIPRGTAKTTVEVLPLGAMVRRDGRLETVPHGAKTRLFDFGRGPLQATLLRWGDVFTAFHSTGIPNIENYAVLPKALLSLSPVIDSLRPLFGLPAVQKLLKWIVQRMPPGPTPEERARTRCTVWGEVADDQGSRAVARLRGPEAGAGWTTLAALAVMRRVLAGDAPPGFQTPGKAYGPDLVLECDSVTREDLP